MESVKVSIVTVVYNDANGLVRTFDSIIDQEYKNYESVVVDGGSTDDSLAVIQEYKQKFQNMGITMTYVSEKDHGIYDAMNKGIGMANGTWSIFMNAGDCFYSKDALKMVFESEDYCDSHILYGRWVTVRDSKETEGEVYLVDKKDQEKYGHIKGLKIYNHHVRKPSSHQAMFFRTSLLKERNYDTSFPIMGDLEWFIFANHKGYKSKFVNEYICKFDFGGVSSLKLCAKHKESIAIRHKYGMEEARIMEIGKYIIWYILEKTIRIFYRRK